MKTGLCLVLFIQSAIASAQARWDGGGGDAEWSNAANWVGDLVPSNSANVVLDNSAFAGNYFVRLPAGSTDVVLNTLAITPSAGNTIVLELPVTNTSGTALQVMGPGDALVIGNGAIFRNSSGAVSGTPVSVNTSNFFRINNGGRYTHNTQRGHTNNLISRLSTAAGTEEGIFEFDVPGTGSYLVSASGRTFGTLVFSSIAAGGLRQYTSTGISPLTVRGNLQLLQGSVYRFGITNILDVYKNLLIASQAVLDFSDATTGVSVFVRGDVDIAGTVTESGNGVSTFELNGTALQRISVNGVISNSINFSLDNSLGAMLQTQLVIPANLFLINGKLITNNSKLLVMKDNATWSGASVNSFVEGPMKKIGDEAFIFPVGVGGIFSPIGVSGGGNIADEFTAAYKRGNPQSLYGPNCESPLDHVSFVEYYELEKNVGGLPRTVTLSVTEYSFSTDLVNIRVGWFDQVNSNWKNRGQSGVTAGPVFGTLVTGTVTSDPVSEFGVFTISTTDPVAINPLPISLLEFNADRRGNDIILNWELADRNSMVVRFDIEESRDGNRFAGIGTVFGGGAVRSYHFKTAVEKGIRWYRLRMTDGDGKVSFSRIIFLSEGDKEIHIRLTGTNDVSHSANLSIVCEKTAIARVQVMDMGGRLLIDKTNQLPGGISNIRVYLGELPAGNYLLFVATQNGRSNTIRFMKR